MKLIKEEFVKPDLSKYKIPQNLINKKYGLYHITLECDDMIKLRKALYLIPVRMLVHDPNDIIFTRSHRLVPEGKVMIDQFPYIRNNFKLVIPRDDVEKEILYMKNEDKSDKIVAQPIIYNYQFIGYLLPNSILQEQFLVQEQRHKGIHASYGFYRKDLPKKQVRIYSLMPWKELESKINEQLNVMIDQIKLLNVSEQQYFKERLYGKLYL